MARILFLTWAGGGNQTPALGAAQALRQAGHQVSFAGYASQCARFADAGFSFSVLDQADTVWMQRRASAPLMEALVAGIFACPEHLDDIDRVLAEIRPDLVVVDCLMFGAITALQQRAIPVVVLVHSAPGALAPPAGPTEAITLGPLNELRGTAHLPPIEHLWDAWSPFLTLCASLPQLDPWTAALPASFDYIGPILEQPRSGNWKSPWPVTDHRPLILVSFSTGNAWDQTSRIVRTLKALSGQPCRILVTTGMAEVNPSDVPANAVVQPYVPHAAVLPQVALTISHGGHGTLCASLAQAVPMVLLPNPAADQPALAARVAGLGAGRTLDGETATPDAIAQAVHSVIEDHACKHAAARLAAAIASANATTQVVRRLEA